MSRPALAKLQPDFRYPRFRFIPKISFKEDDRFDNKEFKDKRHLYYSSLSLEERICNTKVLARYITENPHFLILFQNHLEVKTQRSIREALNREDPFSVGYEDIHSYCHRWEYAKHWVYNGGRLHSVLGHAVAMAGYNGYVLESFIGTTKTAYSLLLGDVVNEVRFLEQPESDRVPVLNRLYGFLQGCKGGRAT
jgi:hypothetical protein